MPHIVIEFSSNVAEHHDIAALVAAVHATALADGLPPKDGLRTRAVSRRHYKIAGGHENYAFIAIVTRIGPGREPSEKKRFITALLDAAESHLDVETGPLAIAWSAELQEIDAEFRVNRNYVRSQPQQGIR